MSENTQVSSVEQARAAHWLTMSMSIGRLEGKIDQLLASHVNQKETTDDHEVRIRALEKGRWKLVGAMSVAGTVFGTFITWILNKGGLPT